MLRRAHAGLPLAAAVASLLAVVAPIESRAASKIAIATIGGEAPGGGQFLGPALTALPAAAGQGWVAFRTLITAGKTNEQVVAKKLTAPLQTNVVAAIGDPAGSRNGKSLGTFKQFLGRPTVNANGDVAFTALLTNSDAIPGGPENVEQPVGVFLYRNTGPEAQRLRVVAAARDVVPGMGALDLAPIEDQVSGSSLDILRRTPGLNDAGSVAFVAATFDENSGTPGGAVFVAALDGAPQPLVAQGTPFADGTLGDFGPPALNNGGVVAFRGSVSVGDNPVDGVFRADATGVVRLAKDFDNFVPPDDPENLQSPFGFGELVSLNDAGDVAFTAGGLLDLTSFTSSDLQYGTFVAHDGSVFLVTYPGRLLGTQGDGLGRIRGGELGPDGGGAVAAPVVQPDGSVVAFAELTGGNGQAFVRASPPGYGLTSIASLVVRFGGNAPDPSPLGGVLFAAESGPVADAAGNLSFFVRLGGGASTAEALLFKAPGGSSEWVVVGEASKKGLLGGPPFSSPVVSDADDVVFKSFLAAAPGALGLFRWRRSTPDQPLSLVARTGDPLPLACPAAIQDLPGEASINAAGAVAFTALAASCDVVDPADPTKHVVEAGGRGIFVADGAGLRKIVMPDDPVSPAPPDAQFDTIATNPLMMADGSVVFRASFAYEDPLLFSLVREEAIFRMDPAGTLSFLVRTSDQAPGGQRFFRFRDASTDGTMIAFRAPLGDADSPDPNALPLGVFLLDPSRVVRAIAMQNDPVGNGTTLATLSGRPAVDAAGDVALVAKDASDQTMIVRQRADGTRTFLAGVGRAGPAGGTYRSLGRPAMAANGHLAFRVGFEKGTGGTGGFFLARDAAALPMMQIGESDGDGAGGRITSVGPTPSLNAADHLAFVGSVSAGKARNAVFLAAPASLDVQSLRVRLRERDVQGITTAFGTMQGRARLTLGDLGKALRDPKDGLEKQAVTIVLSDASGRLVSATVPKGGLRRSGAGWSLKRHNPDLRRLQIRQPKTGPVQVTFATSRWKSPYRDANRLDPQLSIRVDVGAHSGGAILPCTIAPGSATCPGS